MWLLGLPIGRHEVRVLLLLAFLLFPTFFEPLSLAGVRAHAHDQVI
jgi:hypothetical protein